jgi:anaerobic magnesium-protoporphyrin IX monomethyl ester cyclase
MLGGIHATFMYQQVLTEAPWIDAIVRGEGEEVSLDLVRAIDDGALAAARAITSRGIAYPATGRTIVATTAAPTVKDLDAHQARTGASSSGASTSTSRSASGSRSRTWRAAARSPARSARSGSSGATTASATRRRWSTRSRRWCDDHDVGFFILADEEPTINRKKFIAFCEELIARGLPTRCRGASTPA